MSTIQKEIAFDHAAYLELHGMPYRQSGWYYQAGEVRAAQGWILHISVIAQLADGLFRTILPVIAPCPFKIIRDKMNLQYLNAGYQGFNRIGKVVCIYPETEEDALLAVERLLPALRTFRGPAVLTDFYLGAVLYARYGSFRSENLNYQAEDPNALITDGNGMPFRDHYSIPPVLPEGIGNPLSKYILPSKYSRPQHILHNKYWVQQPLAVSVKGNVLLARVRKGASSRKCILKQGRENMIADDAGHDMKDRIKWQFAVHKDLQNDILVPKVFDYFEVEGDGYLSMEYIGGTSLNQWIFNTYANSLWPYLPMPSKKELLAFAKNILSSLEKIHAKGYVHRDVTSNNFIVTRKKKICFIDFELAWSFKDAFPNPPFESATIGYASPHQLAGKIPAIQDDIYSAGALLITFLTGFEPMFIIEKDLENVKEKLIFLSGEREMATLIVRCLDPAPEKRPTLDEMISLIKKMEAWLDLPKPAIAVPVRLPDPGITDLTIQRALDYLGDNRMLSGDGLWISSGQTGEDQLQTNAMMVREVFPGMHQGVAGILYMLSKADANGFDLTPIDDTIAKAWEYCEELLYTGQLQHQTGSLYFGKAGLAVAIATVKANGLIPADPSDPIKLRELFSQPELDLSILHGVAGQGIGLLRCRDYVENYQEIANHYAAILILLQQKDGSWITPDAQGKAAKNTGFGYGIAGIVYFLLEYYQVSGLERIGKAARLGLSYLERKAIRTEKAIHWNNSDTDSTMGGWWAIGTPGTALTFLKAFQVTGLDKYRVIAEKALNGFPEVFTHFNLSQQLGLSGLGEIYLEAASILDDDKYRAKARWIAGLLTRLSMTTTGYKCFWRFESSYFTAPGLMAGVSGIIHFLLRSRFPDKIAFPVLGPICPGSPGHQDFHLEPSALAKASARS